jgi:hypothetical protein
VDTTHKRQISAVVKRPKSQIPDMTIQPKRGILTPERREQIFLRHARKFRGYWQLLDWRPAKHDTRGAAMRSLPSKVVS